MKQITVKNRYRLNKKLLKQVNTDLQAIYGPCIDLGHHTVERATSGEYELYFIDGKILAFKLDKGYALTVRGLLEFKPEKFWVTVDMGAVKFVTNGADVMAPGIIDADPAITPGTIIWVRDEKNKRPLAVGEALMSGEEMVAAQNGKAVRSIHYVGDKLWNVEG